MSKVWSRTLALVLVVPQTVIGGCGAINPLPASPEKETSGTAKPIDMPDGFKNKCDAAKGQLRPLILEWAAPDRAALETQAKQGQLVVHYEGCELSVLRRCKAPKKMSYGYTAITPKDESVTMTNAQELYASIPVYAAKFEGKLAQSGRLTAEMTIVGEYGVSGVPALDQLEGECDGATHVVTALTVGAFSFFAGTSNEKGASASVLGAGAGVQSAKSHDALSRDGDPKSCGVSRRGDASPPDGCGALLRLELAEIKKAGEGIPDCKPGTVLVGKACQPVPKPSKLSPDDENFVDEKQGFEWGNRCYLHYKAGAHAYARAACTKALEANPDAATKSLILYSFAMVEFAQGDPVAGCERLSQSSVLKKNSGVQKELEKQKCSELLKLLGAG